MGNKIYVDKKPSKIENIISFNSSSIDQNIINNIRNNIIEKECPTSNSYQHLSMWCLSENINFNGQILENGINNNNNLINNNQRQPSEKDNNSQETNNINNIVE